MYKYLSLAIAAVVLVVFSFAFRIEKRTANVPPTTNANLERDFYLAHVQPIFNQRCVACHSCFNAPCQLDLTAYSGISRGASHVEIYDFPLKEARTPTRIGIDAATAEEWRKKDFFSVLDVTPKQESILTAISDPSHNESGHLVDADRKKMCVDQADQLEAYFKSDAGLRMPLGLPALSTAEFALIKNWVKDGAHGPSGEALLDLSRPLSHKGAETLKTWENEFNLTDFRHRLTSRYIFEHLFAAHLQVEGVPGELYRLVRAKPDLEAVEELPSRRPYDDLEQPFVYRLKKYSNTVVSKTNLLYQLDEKHRQLWKKIFFDPEWETGSEAFPKYGPTSANAFVTFSRIPTESRYRFLLEDAYYHISTFIKGPVCRGQTALNVINDQFWVVFLEPGFDKLVSDRELYTRVSPLMSPPASSQDEIKLFQSFRSDYWNAVRLKYKAYEKSKTIFSAEALWNDNPNSLLTVYRHFDSAQVIKGAWGEVPRTVWVLDYQVFEDIYYNLVAGYDVFGPMIHQLNTRLYMDVSRISAEDMYLNFLPSGVRTETRAGWYRETPESKKSVAHDLVDLFGGDVKTLSNRKFPYLGGELESSSPSPMHHTEFIERVLAHRFEKEVASEPDEFNRLAESANHYKGVFDWMSVEKSVGEKLRSVAGRKGAFAKFMPDSAILRVKSPWGNRTYTVIHNKDHFNVSLLLFEDERRDPAGDTVNFVPGFATTYPNEFYEVQLSELGEFVDELSALNTEDDYKRWRNRFAISRRGERFWPLADELNREDVTYNLNDPGLLDLSRYAND